MFKHPYKLCLLFFLSSFFQNTINAQNFTISGIITDKETNEVLIGAYVFCPQTGMGSVTNNYGYYSLNIPYGTKNIMFLNEGYFAKIDTTLINSNTQIDVGLRIMEDYDLQTDPFYNVQIVEEVTKANDTSDAPKKSQYKKQTSSK